VQKEEQDNRSGASAGEGDEETTGDSPQHKGSHEVWRPQQAKNGHGIADHRGERLEHPGQHDEAGHRRVAECGHAEAIRRLISEEVLAGKWDQPPVRPV